MKESQAGRAQPEGGWREGADDSGAHSSKNKKVHGTIGDKADPAKNKKLTRHNVASKIDKAEQSRTAKALGAKGDSPKLPKTGRRPQGHG